MKERNATVYKDVEEPGRSYDYKIRQTQKDKYHIGSLIYIF